MANYVKFKTNVPEQVMFNFDTPKEYDGKFGKQYSYGVSWRGLDAYLSATEILNDKLQQIGNLKGRDLEIEKVEGDGGRKYWVIKENGQEISFDKTSVSERRLAKTREIPDDKLDQIRIAFKALEKRIEILEGLQEAKALELHTATHDYAKAATNRETPVEIVDVEDNDGLPERRFRD